MLSSSSTSTEKQFNTSMNQVNTAPRNFVQDSAQNQSGHNPKPDLRLIGTHAVQSNLALPTPPDDYTLLYSFDPLLPVLDMTALTPLEADDLCLGIVGQTTRHNSRNLEKSSEGHPSETGTNHKYIKEADDNTSSECSSVNVSNIMIKTGSVTPGSRQNISILFPTNRINLPSITEDARQTALGHAQISPRSRFINSIGEQTGNLESRADKQFKQSGSEHTFDVQKQGNAMIGINVPSTALKREVSATAENQITKKEHNLSIQKVKSDRSHNPCSKKVQKAYHCPRCNRPFEKRTNCKRHINIMHHQIKSFECAPCSKLFSTKQNLMADRKTKTHISRTNNSDSSGTDHSKQTGPSDADVSSINRLISSLGGLIENQELLVDQKLHQAGPKHHPYVQKEENGILERNFPPVERRNRSSTTAEQHTAEKKTKKTIKNLNPVHGNRSSIRKLRKVYHCPCCYRQFDRKSNCKRHIDIIHCRSRNFECYLCSKSFTTKQNLMEHKRSKTHIKRLMNSYSSSD